MTQLAATAVCVAFILYLFRGLDQQGTSKALWIPSVWVLIAASRSVSVWLGLAPVITSSSDYVEGSPLDRVVFLLLIVAGVVVLARRNLAWGRLFTDNKWIVIYVIFCLVSAAWSDHPFILFKRWIKDLGAPVMALVILTDRRAYDGLAIVLRRAALLLIPLSVLFLRYLPSGRQFHVDGTMMYVGVGSQKNDLGLLCLVAGLYLFWELLRRRQGRGDTSLSAIKMVTVGAMTAWLLYMSDSKTSFVCLVIGVCVLYVFNRAGPARHPYWVLAVSAVAALTTWVLDESFNIRAMLFEALGRNATLTNRTEVWATLQKFEVNPWIGAGFMSFWTGERMDDVWTELGAPINQAHNGYLEQYLNLGYVGVAFILIIVLTAVRRIARQFETDRSSAALRLCLIIVALVYNYTEAAFYGTSVMWLLLLFACVDVSGQRLADDLAQRRRASTTAGFAR